MSIFWLRNQLLLANAQYTVLIILPYIFAWIYKYLIPQNQIEDNFILLICLPMLFSMSVGNLISSIVSEEKEKNNLKELYLSGLSHFEYVIGSLIHPVFIAIAGIILIPILIGKTNFENYSTYFIVSLLTGIAILLANLLIGILSKSLSQAQIIGVPLMMGTMLLPLFNNFNEHISNYIDYTYIGGFINLLQSPEDFSLNSLSLYALLTWLIILTCCCLWGFKRIKVKKS